MGNAIQAVHKAARNNPGLIDEKHRLFDGVFSYLNKLSIDL